MADVILIGRVTAELAVEHVVELLRTGVGRVLDLVVPACASSVQRKEAAAALAERQPIKRMTSALPLMGYAAECSRRLVHSTTPRNE